MVETGAGKGQSSQPPVKSAQVEGTPDRPWILDPNVDVNTRVHRAIELTQAAVAACPPGTVDRFKKLDDLACAVADRYSLLNEPGTGVLLEALDYAKQALEAAPRDHVYDQGYDPTQDLSSIVGNVFKNIGSVWNTLRAIYDDLYTVTNDFKYLELGIKYGHLSIDFLDKHREVYDHWIWHFLYGRRTDMLAALFMKRYRDANPEVGGMEQDLDCAICYAGAAADNTPGEQAYNSLKVWSDLLVIKSGIRNKVDYIDGALSVRGGQPKKLLDFAEGESSIAKFNYLEYSLLMCRRWQMTDSDEDFDKMIEASKEMVKYFNSSDPPQYEYIGTSETVKDVLRACAMNYVAYHEAQPKFHSHVPSLETGVKLFTKLLNMIPMSTKTDFEERDVVVGNLHYFVQQRWQTTQKPLHGFELDDVNVHSAQHSAQLNAMNNGDVLQVDEDSKHCSYGFSAGCKQTICSFDRPSLPIQQPRFLFLDPVKPENWIRKRNEDGTLELGATPQDKDVWEFCLNYEQGKAEKTLANESDEIIRKIANGEEEFDPSRTITRGLDGVNHDSKDNIEADESAQGSNKDVKAPNIDERRKSSEHDVEREIPGDSMDEVATPVKEVEESLAEAVKDLGMNSN